MLLDRVIGYFSPAAGLRRTRARAAIGALAAFGLQSAAWYEGAAGGRRMDGWRTSGGGPNAEIAAATPRIRERAQDLVRNDPFAARGVSVWVNNAIGAGIVPSLGGAAAKVRRLERLLATHLETLAIDVHGRHDLYGLQRLAMRAMVESGEVLICREDRPASAGLSLPFQIRLLEADHLDDSKDGPLPGGGRIMGGIELGENGQRLAYWLRREHPRDLGSAGLASAFGDSVRVPADRVIHLYESLRPGQMRGITWLAPVILLLRELHDCADAHLLRQKISACYAVFETVPDGDAVSDAAVATKSALEPGIHQIMPPGHDVKFGVPPQTDGYREYMQTHQRAVAMGLNIPSELLTGDYSEINFSAGRMSHQEFERGIDAVRWGTVIPQMCAGIARWFLEAAEAVLDTSGVTVTWTPPARPMFSPREDMAALEKGLALNITSRSQAIRERGYDPPKVMAEIAAERATMAKLGIPVSTDPKAPAAPAAPPTEQEDEEQA